MLSIGFDDAPLDRQSTGPTKIFGAIYSDQTLHAVVSGHIERDGNDSTAELGRLTALHREHLGLVFLQGITLAGFNVIDIEALHAQTGLPVLVVARKKPDLPRIQAALLAHVPQGAHKWALIKQAGEMEPCGPIFIQRRGLTFAQAQQSVQRFCFSANIPEPLRTAHLIAGGVTRGNSHGQRV